MGMRIIKLSVSLLAVLAVSFILQQLSSPLSGLERPLQSSEDFPVPAFDFIMLTTQDKLGLQTVYIGNVSTLPDRRQDTVYSLDPKREGHGPLSFSVLLKYPVGYHV
uniref:hypothetical protein n=1 Tax=Escherichia coli TaxID=562 RepID=UPI0021C319AF|nr:hypothetical protein [Escherichia coli]CAH8250726.1 Uncharacterised protein [Escherichia coli]